MGMGPGSSVSRNVTAILEDTDNLPIDPADASDIASMHAVPAAGATANALLRDVIGNKSDNIAGTSLVSKLRSVGGDNHVHHKLFTGDAYFVNATDGDNTNDGKTPGTAKATIAAATTLMTAGDAVAVNAGTYNENVVLALVGMEMWCEIGVLIDPDSGVGITVSGDSCKIVGDHKVTPASAVGVLVTGDGCHLISGTVIGGTSGMQVTGSDVIIDDYAVGFQTAISFDIQGIRARIRDCSTVGNAATIGYGISGGVDTGALLRCTSAGHQTAGYSIGSGTTNWTVLDCSSGGGDGRWVDTDSVNVWSNFSYADEVFTEMEFTDNSTTFNIFKVTGIVSISSIYGHVEEVLNAQMGNCKLEMAAGAHTENLTTAVTLNSLPVGTFIGKIATAGDALSTGTSAAPQVIENTNFKEPRVSSIIVAEAGTATYVRLVSDDAVGDKDGVIHWHCHWTPLSDDGFVESV